MENKIGILLYLNSLVTFGFVWYCSPELSHALALAVFCSTYFLLNKNLPGSSIRQTRFSYLHQLFDIYLSYLGYQNLSFIKSSFDGSGLSLTFVQSVILFEMIVFSTQFIVYFIFMSLCLLILLPIKNEFLAKLKLILQRSPLENAKILESTLKEILEKQEN